MAKVERIIDKEDGSQVRITAQECFGAGLFRSVDVYVHTRPSTNHAWELMSDRPADGWKTMPLQAYDAHGRSPMLRATGGPGPILATVQELNKLTQPGFRIKLQERLPSSFPIAQELVENPEDLDADLGNPYANLIRKLIRTLDRVPGALDAVPLLDPVHYPGIAFPEPKSTIDVSVILSGNHELMSEVFMPGATGNTLGAFLVDSIDLSEDDSAHAKAFRILVSADQDFLIQDALSELQDDDLDFHRHVYAHLVTLTHELCHVTDFIAHGHGLTPHDVDVWCDEGTLNFGLHEITTGAMIRQDMQEPMAPEVASQIMEERVEEQGKRLLSQCLNDPAFVRAFNNYVEYLEDVVMEKQRQAQKIERQVQ